MIVLVLSEEWNERLQKNEQFVSHGVDFLSLTSIPMSCETLDYYTKHNNARWNDNIHAASGIIAVTVDGEHVWHYERGFSEKWLKAHPILADCTGLSARQSFDRDAFMNETRRENFIDQHGFAP